MQQRFKRRISNSYIMLIYWECASLVQPKRKKKLGHSCPNAIGTYCKTNCCIVSLLLLVPLADNFSKNLSPSTPQYLGPKYWKLRNSSTVKPNFPIGTTDNLPQFNDFVHGWFSPFRLSTGLLLILYMLIYVDFLSQGIAFLRSLIRLTWAKFRRRTSHEPNRMQMSKILCSPSFAFDSAHVKYGVWTGPYFEADSKMLVR